MVINRVLKGKQIDIRACTADLASDRYVAWLNDKEVNRYLETRYVRQTIQTVRDYIERVRLSDNEFLLAIIAHDTHKHIGNIHVTVNKYHKRAFFGYMIGDRSYWGKKWGSKRYG